MDQMKTNLAVAKVQLEYEKGWRKRKDKTQEKTNFAEVLAKYNKLFEKIDVHWEPDFLL